MKDHLKTLLVLSAQQDQRWADAIDWWRDSDKEVMLEFFEDICNEDIDQFNDDKIKALCSLANTAMIEAWVRCQSQEASNGATN